MKYIILALLLSSCSIAIPKKTLQFPEAPSVLMVQPQKLNLINKEYSTLKNNENSTIKLSDYVKSVTTNYGICESNSNQLFTLQSWIQEQSDLFNSKQP